MNKQNYKSCTFYITKEHDEHSINCDRVVLQIYWWYTQLFQNIYHWFKWRCLYSIFFYRSSQHYTPLPLSELWVLVCLSDTIYFCYMYICHIQQYNHKHMHQKAFWPIILVALVFLKVGHLHAKLPWLSIVLSIASVFLNDIFPILSIIQILVFLYQLL